MQIVEEAMMPAMKQIGEKFKNQEVDIVRIHYMGKP
jgi:cobalamin-dependent methionine synthase I